MENRFIQKIPLNPPLPKGENARKDSQLSSASPPECGQAGMTTIGTEFAINKWVSLADKYNR